MSLDNVTLRAATLDDLTGIAAIYNQLWCNTLRNRGDVEAADFCARFNIAMQLQRSPIALVAEAEGRIIAACCIGIFENGKPRTNPTWVPCYDEMFAQATEMAKTADAKLEGSLFGDSREKATADRFAATGNEYAQGQLNLIIIVPEWQGKGLGRELIDLLRLADLPTPQPIRVRNEPAGSTTTIITNMYQEHGVMPSPNMAGLMAGAILSDTVMFKSPTSTAVDRRMADRMARIANISLDELGKTIFSASISDDKPADTLLFTDFKDFHIADHDFGVSQITCVDSERMMQRKDEFLAVMQKTMAERGYTLMILMLTDVLLEGTHLLYLGDEDIITQAFGVQLKDHTCFLPGVVSRKKQVIPMLTALWG